MSFYDVPSSQTSYDIAWVFNCPELQKSITLPTLIRTVVILLPAVTNIAKSQKILFFFSDDPEGKNPPQGGAPSDSGLLIYVRCGPQT